jgi:hypothetical protein
MGVAPFQVKITFAPVPEGSHPIPEDQLFSPPATSQVGSMSSVAIARTTQGF